MNLADRLMRFKVGKSEADQDRALRLLVSEAYNTVPFHREAFKEAGLRPTDIRTVRDVAKLPIMPRQALLDNEAQALLRRGVQPARALHTITSGSSGLPITVYMSRAEMYYRRWVLLHTIRRYGKLPFPLRILDIGPMVPHEGKSLEQRLGFLEMLRVPGDMPLDKQLSTVAQSRANIIEGYPTCLELLAEEILAYHMVLPLQPRLVVCRGEVMKEEARQIIAQAFRCKVVDLYNCEEVGNITWECPKHQGVFHVNTDNCIVEIVDNEGKPLGVGQEGSIVVTNLFNHTMPLIRYELGDRAEFLTIGNDECECGAYGPTIGRVAGRDDDFLLAPNGRRISSRVPENLVFNALRSADDPQFLNVAVRRYQIIQESLYLVRVKVVWKSVPEEELRHRIEWAVAVMWESLECRVDDAEEILLEPSGKFRKVIRAF